MKTKLKETKDFIPLLVKNFYKRYSRNKDFAVENLSFKVRAGEFHGFIGANGAGKTTTIKSIIGAYARVKGEIKIFGYKQSSVKGKKRIGYIPEVANFPKELNAFQYLKHMASISGMPVKKAKVFAAKNLVKMGMKNFMYKNPNNMSSGQKKKILLIQALITNPDLIIMDEPAANLDPQARKDFFNSLKKLQEEGKSIFISSHILVEIAQYVDVITIIDNGKLMYSGQVEDARNVDNPAYIFKFGNKNNEMTFIEEAQKYEFLVEKNNIREIFVKINKKSDFQKLLSIVTSKKLELEYVKENKRTLQDIYDYYVEKGRKMNSEGLNL